MKKLISFCISFMLLFAVTDLSAIKSVVAFNFDKNISVSEIVQTQADIYNAVKNVVSDISDIVINEVGIFLTPSQKDTSSSINTCNLFFVENTIISFSVRTETCFSSFVESVAEDNANDTIKIFLLWLILMYIIKYIGLLRTFWNKDYKLFRSINSI